jgi:hypothetical protein
LARGGGGVGREVAQLVDHLPAEIDVGACRAEAGCPGQLLEVEGDILHLVPADATPLEPLEVQHVQIFGLPAR